MRRLSLGALLFAGGLLLSLPFRRPPLETDEGQGSAAAKSQPLDDQAIELLVQEVTQDVQAPVVFDPQTDYSPTVESLPPRRLPLKYEELAVPVDPDPRYERRFNAAVGVVETQARRKQDAARVAELERRFAQKKFADSSIAQLISGHAARPASVGGSSPRPGQDGSAGGTANPPENARGQSGGGARLTSSGRAKTGRGTRSARASSSSSETAASPAPADATESAHFPEKTDDDDHSVLSPLPPPESADDAARRARHWIRQPD